MKTATHFCVFILLLIAVSYTKAQPGTCGGDCLLTKDCITESGDTTCRCTYLKCQKIPEGVCGGGCVSDAQCQEWAPGDLTCKCNAIFECVSETEMMKPGYQIYTKFIQATKGAVLRKKMDKIMREEAEKQQ